MKPIAWDVILVGAGLANGLIAWRLKAARPDLRVLVLEQSATMGGNHTWSFHDSDLTAEQRAWIAPLVTHHWPGYTVHFPELTRAFDGGYSSIASTDFARIIGGALGDALRVACAVTEVTPTTVTLATGEVLHAGAVIDGRGVRASASVALGYQTFLGQEMRLAAPHGLTRPIIMDATVAQGGGYRFVYVLPLTPDTLLIEDTHYVDRGHIEPSQLRANIAAYAKAHQWDVLALLREERGSLPITLAGDFDAYWKELAGQPCSGLRAGLFHPATGYSLPHAVRLAERIAALPDWSASALFAAVHDEAATQWRSQGFFRLLNRMLFMAGRADRRWRVIQRFYHLRAPLIARFYAGKLTMLDKLRLVSGKPPVPVGEAIVAARKTHPKHIHLSGHAHEQQ